MSLFCRHNRITANCPICSREFEDELRSKAPTRPARERSTRSSSSSSRSRSSSTSRSGVVTRRLAPRSADDGYRTPLAPGLHATADAERLAAALAGAAARLEFPGPHPEVGEIEDIEEATWLAFLLVLAGADAPELQEAILAGRPSWASGETPELPEGRRRTAEAYRAWAERAGSQEAAFTGEAAWTSERRFARVFERLALPGFGRGARFELLVVLGAADRYPLRAGALQLQSEDDATTLAAKRLLVSGDALLLERRARELAEASEVPLAALDRALADWNTPGRHADLTAEPPPAIRSALGLR
jgi:hypothetical protein